jgi:CRISPR-associated exonuclease Cas4
LLELTVNDLKQFVYCPRIVYYHYVMPVEKKPTYKMEHGARAEEVIERLEARRKLKSSELPRGKGFFTDGFLRQNWAFRGKLTC